ncbi:MAG: stage sporulation protein [Clostridia bacterium]|nr:stage sporulation protein [Clostridia bacterium]
MFFILIIAINLFILYGLARERALPAYNSHNLIRLHIVANSDAPLDQQLKYEVRDALLARMGRQLVSARNLQEARAFINENLSVIEKVAQEEIEGRGKDYPVRVEFGHFKFPDRAYGQVVLPAGEYEAVKVIIGSGKGQNWWCVLFPPLCLVDIAETKAGEGGNDAWPVMQVPVSPKTAPVEVRFKLLELWHTSRNRLAGIFNNL